MDKYPLPKLKIDEEFKALIPPLSENEYQMLEHNIRKDGCRDPIVVWNGVIIDGHNRYAICQLWGIPFQTHSMFFSDRMEVIAWICENQLGRRNLNEETRRYLIGKRYRVEQVLATKKNPDGLNQYVSRAPEKEAMEKRKVGRPPKKTRTSDRLSAEYHVSHFTVEKYGVYSKAIDTIGEKVPAIVPRILNGECKIAHRDVVTMAQMPQSQLQKLEGDLKVHEQRGFVPYMETRARLSEPPRPKIHPGIKNMPEYDPDADVNGLALTVPTWTNSIEKTRSKTDLREISDRARKELQVVLVDLRATINTLLAAMEDEA